MACPKEECVHIVPSWGPEHDVDNDLMCWCSPKPDFNELSVIIHRPPEEASH